MTNQKKAIHNLRSEVNHLRQKGIALPRNPVKAMQAAQDMRKMASTPGQFQKDLSAIGSSGREADQLQQNASIISAMRRHRKVGSIGDAGVAIPRFYDPLEFWDLSGLPWNMADEGHRHKLHKWMRLYYATHYLVPVLIDIFTRFPLVGMDFYCKDRELSEFYKSLFLNDLNYEDFLVQLGREYWTVGEAFPLGSFNDTLGVWEREELLNPEDIIIENFPLLGTSQMKVMPPEYLKRMVSTKTPPRDYKQLELNFPELIPYALRGEPFPVSDVLLKQVAYKVTSWDDHGTPILLRGLRTLIHEEKLLASQDAIAERLYSPMILAKLGVNDLGGDQGPWIPGPEQLESFRDDMDIALSSDFRLMVYHYGLEIENVFGRETVPNLWEDFDRIERRIMQVFGINPSLLSAGSNSQPYASSALQAEFMNQILRTYQGFLKDHYRERALVVAEAQGHYDYEKKGQTRVPIMEEVVLTDPETGKMRVERRHKLLVPEIEFQSLDLRDEATERQFLSSLRSMGVPISDENMMVGVGFEFKDSLDEMQDEMIQKTVAQQMAKLQTYKILKQQGLPIPAELRAEIEAPDGMPGAPPGGEMPGAPPGGEMGGAPPGGGEMGGIVMPPAPPELGPGGFGGAVPGGGPPPAGPLDGPMGTVPEVSNERRPGMPTASVNSNGVESELDRQLRTSKEILQNIERKKKKRHSDTSNARPLWYNQSQEDEWSADEIVHDKVPPAFKINKDDKE